MSIVLQGAKTVLAVFSAFSVFLYIFFATAQSPALAAEEFSLREAVETGLKNSSEFSSADNQRRVNKDQVAKSRAPYFPSLSMEAEGGYEATSTRFIDDAELYRRRGSLTLTQILFDGFRTTNSVKKQKALLQSAESRSYKASELAALNVVNSYLEVLRRRELVAEAEKNIVDNQDIFGRIKDGADNGKFNLGDLEQARARLVRAKANLDSVRQNFKDAGAAYLHTVGTTPPQSLSVPFFSPAWLPDDLDAFVSQAKLTSPSLASYRSDIEAANAEYEQRKYSRYPELSLQLSDARGQNVDGVRGNESNGAALVVMRWDLFNGGADAAQVREALHKAAATRDDKTSAERTLENDIRNAWSARESASLQLEEFKSQVEADTNVFAIYQEQFQLNRRSLVDLLNAQNELFTSKSNRINVFYSQLFSGYQLLALRGDLLKTLRTEEVAAAPVKTEEKKPVAGAYAELGAFRNVSEAEDLWQKLLKEDEPVMKGLEKKIVRTETAKDGVYYRLRTGPMMNDAAQSLCRELSARKTEGCSLVTP